MSDVPKSHPRYHSLKTRDKIVDGVTKGVTSVHGLMAHGRGEAFDYLIQEKTNRFAHASIKAAAAMLLTAHHPVISVNGNAAALVPRELANLANFLDAPCEINLFHPSKKREGHIRAYLKKNGAKKILLPQKNHKIKYLDSNRKYVNKEGMFIADIVFVPLEDGDRTEALIKNKKKVITVDLNPMSRTARKATITIVDNILRTMPALIDAVKKLQKSRETTLKKMVKEYNNKYHLKLSMQHINNRLKKLTKH